jgi:AAA15 family ATPase/GTPase
LQRLCIESLGGKEVIQGNIGLGHPVPMSFMGEGIRRVLSIVLAIGTSSGGNVLVDEVENGLHYSVLTRVWQAIGHAARQANVQVFATTHSYECIVAAHEAFTANGPYDLRLFRLDRIGEEIKVAAYDQDVLGYATEMNHEVR